MERGPAPKPERHGAEWFPADVKITDTQTGEQRVFLTWEYEGGGGWSDFNWSENNFACDCNRSMFFRRASGEPDTDDVSCAGKRFRVDEIRDARDGRLLYEEKPEGAPCA